VPGSLAFEINVRNDVRGIGLEVRPRDRVGQRRRLESVVYMDAVDPYLEHDGFEILGTRSGTDGCRGSGSATRPARQRPARPRPRPLELLPRLRRVRDGGQRHRGPRAGRFETVDFARGYSALDQYAMGLRATAEVPPFFFVDGADDFRRTAASVLVGTRGRRQLHGRAARGPHRGRDRRAGPARARPHARRRGRCARRYVLVADAPPPRPSRAAVRSPASARASRSEYRRATGGRATVDTTLP
jgi:hypothetical protein